MITANACTLQLALDVSGLRWADRAACAEIDPDLWFPEKGGSAREPKAVCQKCPVQADCLEYALQRGERFGIYGGLSERERRRLKRQFGGNIAAAVASVTSCAEGRTAA